VEGHSVISSDVLGAYAADAAREVDGVAGLVEGPLHRHHGVKVVEGDGGAVAVELHLSLEWGADVPAVGAAVQERVRAYLARMADVTPSSVDVVVDLVVPPAA
jgi:uncharacterized alkaline shock family protein YloU